MQIKDELIQAKTNQDKESINELLAKKKILTEHFEICKKRRYNYIN